MERSFTKRLRLGSVALIVLFAAAVTACRPAETPRSQGGKALIIGDSYTHGADSQWDPSMAPGRPVVYDGVIGRHVYQGTSRLKAIDLSPYDQIVVGLGANDYLASEATMGTWINQFMAAAGNRQVVWVNLDLSQTRLKNAGAINRAITAAAERHQNLTVGDWNMYLNSRTNAAASRASDGLHYNSIGYTHLAQFQGRLVSGSVTLTKAARAGKVRANYDSTDCHGVTIQLRRPRTTHSKLALNPTERDVGDARNGEILEFFIQSMSSACSTTWDFTIN